MTRLSWGSVGERYFETGVEDSFFNGYPKVRITYTAGVAGPPPFTGWGVPL